MSMCRYLTEFKSTFLIPCPLFGSEKRTKEKTGKEFFKAAASSEISIFLKASPSIFSICFKSLI